MSDIETEEIATEAQRRWFIYALIDPRSQEIRYIGWSFDPERRLRDHIRNRKKERGHKVSWIKNLLLDNLKPEMQILDSGFGDWAQTEKDWIAFYKSIGARLTNLTDGGDGMPGYKWTEEQIEKLRKRIFTAEHKQRIAQAKTGKPLSEEHKLVVSLSKKGKSLSAEGKQRLINLHLGKPLSEEHKEKLSAIHKGRAFSDETRKKMSAAQKGKKHPPMNEEQKKKIALAHIGKPGTKWTEEHRRKIYNTKLRKGLIKEGQYNV